MGKLRGGNTDFPLPPFLPLFFFPSSLPLPHCLPPSLSASLLPFLPSCLPSFLLFLWDLGSSGDSITGSCAIFSVLSPHSLHPACVVMRRAESQAAWLMTLYLSGSNFPGSWVPPNNMGCITSWEGSVYPTRLNTRERHP
jgi:hypothetical protein